MKKLTFLLSIVVAASMLTTGCKKSVDSSTSTTPANGVTATIDGSAFTANKIIAQFLGGTNYLEIRGTTGKAGIALLISNPGVGAFKTDSTHSNLNNKLIYSPDTTLSSNDFFSNGDNIVVTSYDLVNKKISGTYAFKGYGKGGVTHTITSGAFTNISFTMPLSSSVAATVAGVAFTPAFVDVSNSSGNVYVAAASGNAGGYPILSIAIPTTTATGTFAVTGNTNYYIGYSASSNTSTDYYSTISTTANVGSIIITKNDAANKTITGTFSATVTNSGGASKAITGGSFTAIYK